MLKLVISFVIILIIVAYAAVVSVGTEVPSAEFIAAALKDQEASCGPSLEVIFEMEFGPLSQRSVEKIRYIRTPAKLVLDQMDNEPWHTKVVYDRAAGEYKKFFTGKVSPKNGSAYDLKSGVIAKGIGRTLFASQSFVETTRYFIHEGPLCDVIGRGTVSGMQEEIDGVKCWRVEIPSTRNPIEKYVVFVDPSIGFCPRKIQTMWRNTPPQIVSFKDYVQIATGVWFPKKMIIDLTTAKHGPVNVECTVTNVNVGKAFDEKYLNLEFPSGTKVSVGGGKNAMVFTVP